VKISIMRTLAPRVEGSPKNNAGKDDSYPLRERAGVRGNIRLWGSFRSLYVPRY
jgi:hypothetical protein